MVCGADKDTKESIQKTQLKIVQISWLIVTLIIHSYQQSAVYFDYVFSNTANKVTNKYLVWLESTTDRVQAETVPVKVAQECHVQSMVLQDWTWH